MTPTIKLVDSTFPHSNSLSLAGDNAGEHPESFHWDRIEGHADVKVFTDLRLHEAVDDSAKTKIALIIESPDFAKSAHIDIINLHKHFGLILTHSAKLLSLGAPFSFYPFGGSRIRRWGVFSKEKIVSVIVGQKDQTEGQQLRHQVASKFANKIDAWGEPYTGYLPSKVPMLRPYRYSVVIENCRENHWFSEKFIDCISQGTVPIYWGCPAINDLFSSNGIIQFTSMDELKSILPTLSNSDYESRMQAIMTNLVIALNYRCSEDWIAATYGEVLFGEES